MKIQSGSITQIPPFTVFIDLFQFVNWHTFHWVKVPGALSSVGSAGRGPRRRRRRRKRRRSEEGEGEGEGSWQDTAYI